MHICLKNEDNNRYNSDINDYIILVIQTNTINVKMSFFVCLIRFHAKNHSTNLDKSWYREIII